MNKTCSKCKRDLPIDCFCKSHSWCRECKREAASAKLSSQEARQSQNEHRRKRYAVDADYREKAVVNARNGYAKNRDNPEFMVKERNRGANRREHASESQKNRRRELNRLRIQDPEYKARWYAQIAKWKKTKGMSPDRVKQRSDYMKDYCRRRRATDEEFRLRRTEQATKRKHAVKGLECTLTRDEWSTILHLQDGRCAKCGVEFNDDNPATRDHIVPVNSRGGLTKQNVQALCVGCNCSKHATIADYRTKEHQLWANGERPMEVQL